MPKPIRIAVLKFEHETVTFLPSETTVEDFVYPGSPAKGEALLTDPASPYILGFVKVAREHEGVELVGIESPLWSKRGTGSGWLTRDTYETYVGRMIEALKVEGPFDGVYLSVHGAMAVRGVARPEAELARRVREVVGSGVPIAATFDPHGNEDEAFLREADMAFTVKYFPHYDSALQGERAARMLVRAIRGDYRPSTVTVKVPLLSPTVLQWTGATPWMDLVQRALVWEARSPDLYVNVFFGFPWADTVDAGMTIQAMSNADPKLAKRAAKDMAEWAWRNRDALLNSTRIYTIPEGVTEGKAAVAKGATPVVLADFSDRSGAATWVLQEVIRQGMTQTIVASVADAETVARLVASGAKPGDEFSGKVGGRLDESAGEPVEIKGKVLLHYSDTRDGDWFLIGFGEGNAVLVTPYLFEAQLPEWITKAGVDLTPFKTVVIKSRVHFRRGWHDNGFAPTILLVQPEQPFLGTTHLKALPYEHL